MISLDPYVLLDRDPIRFDPDGSYLVGKRVLVTGAGGSIGSVICRHVSRLGPEELIMLDRDESALHALQLAMTGRALLSDSSMVLGDIRDQMWIYRLLEQRRPQIVFHAAALKHQPLLEMYPGEAYKTNVLGTRNLLQASKIAKVEVLVNISTDKAANPRCALGSSKRIAERLVSWCAPRRYVSVRFGNVFGSRGSVLDTFVAQLEADMPLTVTDPDMTRFFMSGDEAVSLVIHAGSVGRPGEVLVLDMGDPVRIVDIAERMIFMAGGNGKITYTGFRPGERVKEERLGENERDDRPFHPMISQISVPALPPSILKGVRSSDSSASEIAHHMLTLCDW
jgi:FlaA1/EpsC-like NDP-sugar epimerase